MFLGGQKFCNISAPLKNESAPDKKKPGHASVNLQILLLFDFLKLLLGNWYFSIPDFNLERSDTSSDKKSLIIGLWKKHCEFLNFRLCTDFNM